MPVQKYQMHVEKHQMSVQKHQILYKAKCCKILYKQNQKEQTWDLYFFYLMISQMNVLEPEQILGQSILVTLVVGFKPTAVETYQPNVSRHTDTLWSRYDLIIDGESSLQ